METRKKIFKLIEERKQITANEIAEYIDISRQALYKHLRKMQSDGQIAKIGNPPKVFYSLKEKQKEAEKYRFDSGTEKIINKNYLFIAPDGKRYVGIEGFSYWCGKQNLPTNKTAKEYVATLKKYSEYRKNDLINGTNKILKTFKDVYLDDIYFLDFYSIERFGKTKLGQLLLYAKQSQSKKLMKELIGGIQPVIGKALKKFKIDGVGYIPPTVKRETQFMNELKKNLNLPVKEIVIAKIKTDIIVPQKTLNKLNDRIENAKNTFAVMGTGRFNNIMLIDDAVGSGATMNEVAKKIKDKGLTKKVIGLAITGSFKGFDVISEV